MNFIKNKLHHNFQNSILLLTVAVDLVRPQTSRKGLISIGKFFSCITLSFIIILILSGSVKAIPITSGLNGSIEMCNHIQHGDTTLYLNSPDLPDIFDGMLTIDGYVNPETRYITTAPKDGKRGYIDLEVGGENPIYGDFPPDEYIGSFNGWIKVAYYESQTSYMGGDQLVLWEFDELISADLNVSIYGYESHELIYSWDIKAEPVPEPTTGFLLCCGLLFFAGYRKKYHQK